jgi:GT2 family glycosyltransferase
VLRAKATSLALQTLPRDRFEWRVAFDGVPDDLATRLEADLRAALPRDVSVAFVRTDGRGPGPARDAAAADARHGVLLLSDDDCLLDPDVLARHAEAQRDPALYVGGVTFEDDAREGRPVRAIPPRHPGWWRVAGANASLPTAAFEAVGGFGTDLEGYGGEDVWLGWRLRRAGVPIRGLPSAHVRHVGPDARRAGDVAKGAAAGRNAVRIAALEPATAWRLGVHPLLRRVKRVAFALAGPRLRASGWGAYEWAYVEGAVRETKEAAGRRDPASVRG